MAKNIYVCDFCGYEHIDHSTFCLHLFHDHDISYTEAHLEVKEMQKRQYQKLIDIEHKTFLDNKYAKWYYQIIRNARQKTYDCYTEKHHILPRSLKGPDVRINLITVSAKEHFILHLLLLLRCLKKTVFLIRK